MARKTQSNLPPSAHILSARVAARKQTETGVTLTPEQRERIAVAVVRYLDAVSQIEGAGKKLRARGWTREK